MKTRHDGAPGRKSGYTKAKFAVFIILTLLCCRMLDLSYAYALSPAGYIAQLGSNPSLTNEALESANWLTVKAFGAAGDGMGDDTSEIQAALNAGTHIYFPAGTYVVDQLTITDAAGVVLYGYGATLVKKTGSVTWTRLLDIVSSDNVKIYGLTFDGNKPHVPGSPQQGCGSIYGTRLTNFLFQDLTIRNSYYGSVNLTDCHYGSICSCLFDDIDVGILGMGRANSYLDIKSCVFTGGTSEGVSFGIYSEVTAQELADIGYHDHIRITNCRFTNKDANCIQLRNVKNVLVSDNILERTDSACGTVGIMIDPDAVHCVSIMPDTIVIQANRIAGMLFEGIKVTSGTRITIKNNSFDGIHSFNISAGCGCVIGNNVFVNIWPGVESVIYAWGDSITVLDNHFKVGSTALPCVVGAVSDAIQITAQGNVIWKDSGSPCAAVHFERGSPPAGLAEQGFDIITSG